MRPTGPATEIPYEREPGYAERYRDRRFREGSGPRTARREARTLAALLADASAAGTEGSWLDVPCGAGRLSDLLPCDRAVLADRDRAMLVAHPGPAEWPRVHADAAALPFADGALAGVMCMRLLHHAPSSAARVAVLSELSRVAHGHVVFSFFHSWSLQHVRRMIARRLYKPTSGRHAVSLARIRADCAAARLEIVRAVGLSPGISEQWIVLARPTAAG